MAKRQPKKAPNSQAKASVAVDIDHGVLTLRDDSIPAWFRHSGFPGFSAVRVWAENWWPFICRISKKGAKIQPSDICRAIYFWENYGDFLAQSPNGGWSTVQCACLPTTTRIICEECERSGWDSSSISLVTEFRGTLFIRHPETIPHSSPWPPHDFVVQNPSLPEYRRLQILEAERLLKRLSTKLGPSIPQKPAADDPPKVTDKTTDESGSGVAPRNAKFLEWYEAKGTDTYHKP